MKNKKMKLLTIDQREFLVMIQDTNFLLKSGYTELPNFSVSKDEKQLLKDLRCWEIKSVPEWIKDWLKKGKYSEVVDTDILNSIGELYRRYGNTVK